MNLAIVLESVFALPSKFALNYWGAVVYCVIIYIVVNVKLHGFSGSEKKNPTWIHGAPIAYFQAQSSILHEYNYTMQHACLGVCVSW